MNNDFKPHINRLMSSGLRATKQRLMICKALFGTSKTFHFTIENLKKVIEKNTRSKISLATIYNTIHAFKKKGYVKEILIKNNKTYFDTNTKHHHHFYDEDTKILSDIKEKDISLSKIPKAPDGKKVKKIEVTISLANNNHIQEN